MARSHFSNNEQTLGQSCHLLIFGFISHESRLQESKVEERETAGVQRLVVTNVRNAEGKFLGLN